MQFEFCKSFANHSLIDAGAELVNEFSNDPRPIGPKTITNDVTSEKLILLYSYSYSKQRI